MLWKKPDSIASQSAFGLLEPHQKWWSGLLNPRTSSHRSGDRKIAEHLLAVRYSLTVLSSEVVGEIHTFSDRSPCKDANPISLPSNLITLLKTQSPNIPTMVVRAPACEFGWGHRHLVSNNLSHSITGQDHQHQSVQFGVHKAKMKTLIWHVWSLLVFFLLGLYMAIFAPCLHMVFIMITPTSGI